MYVITLSHNPNWGDSAKLIIFTNNLQFSSDSGYHNLLLMIFHPFIKLPIQNLALKVNLANMIFSVLTLYLLAILLLELGNTVKTSIFLTLCLGLSHLFWHLSVITESYILVSFFLVLCLLLSEKYKKNPSVLKLSAVFFVFGLGIQVNLILAVIFIIIFLPIHSLKAKILIPVLALLLSLLPIIIIMTKEIRSGSTFYEVVIKNFLQQKYKESINIYSILDFKRLAKIITLFLYQFPFLIPLLIIPVFISHNKLPQKYSISSIQYSILFFLIIALSIIYTMPKSIYFLVLASIFFILSISRTIDGFIGNTSKKSYILLLALLILINITIYLTGPHLAKNLRIRISNEVPFRNSARYFLIPWKHNERSSHDFFKYCEQNLDQNSVLISDFTVLKTLEYYKIAGEKIPYETWDVERKDVLQKIKDNIDKKNIYFTGGSQDYAILHKNFHIKRFGILFQVIK